MSKGKKGMKKKQVIHYDCGWKTRCGRRIGFKVSTTEFWTNVTCRTCLNLKREKREGEVIDCTLNELCMYGHTNDSYCGECKNHD